MVMSQELVLEGTGLVKEFVQGASDARRCSTGRSIRRARGRANRDRRALPARARRRCLQLLGGLDLPTQGTVGIAGSAMNELTDAERGDCAIARVGFVYQFHHLLPEFTALENVAMPLLVRRDDPKAAEARGGCDSVARGAR